MPPELDPDGQIRAAPRCFLTTHWSVILSAKEGTPNEAGAALEELCRSYWWPLYAYVRRRGHTSHDAQDLTQEFFARLLTSGFLRAVDKSKGRFRSYLLACMEHFLAKEWRRASAQKRGGRCAFVSMDANTSEALYLQLPSNDASPGQVYDQQWAITLQNLALSRLKEEYSSRGKLAQYEATYHLLVGDRGSQTYAELGNRLEMTEAALKMAVIRMRGRWKELLREEVAKTVGSQQDVEEELRSVLSAWQ